jgi:hypothetical protein
MLGGSAELASGDGGSELHFRAPGCTGVVRVGLLTPNGEMVSLFVRSAGRNARVFYTYRGRTAANPPRFAYLHAKFARVMEAAGLGSGPNPPIVAVK